MRYILILFLISACLSKKSTKKSRVIEESNYNLFVINKNEMNFGVSKEIPKDIDFYINSNFFTKTNESIGLVVIDKVRYSNRSKGGGYFYVKNGIPFIRSNYCPAMTEYAAQTILWGINNGIKNHELIAKKHAQKRLYRTIIGENREGDILVLSSNRIGFFTIGEIINHAMNVGMVEGILLDGGSSIEYKFDDSVNKVTFKSIPNFIKSKLGIKKPTCFIYGAFKK